MTVVAGQVLGARFEIEARVGGGAMGQVYRARDRETGGRVAVKVLLDAGVQSRLRFVREARVLEALSHPGIVAHVAHGALDEGAPWLAMEWLDGEDLAQRLNRGPLPLDEALAFATAVARALGAAHAVGLVHRDVKPSNLWLLDKDPRRPKLLDFGIVGGFATTALATQTGATMGTPGYLAPEQLRSARDVDSRADVYSLGCVLFECVTGHKPFEAEHLMALLAKVVLEAPPRLAELRPDLPADLDALLARLLAKDRVERPAHGEALAHELASLSLGTSSRERVTDAGGVGATEQRLVTVVLVREGGAPDPTVATLEPDRIDADDAAASRVLAAIEATAGGLGATVHALLSSSAVVTFAGAGTAIDRSALAAACALAVRDALPAASIAVATGRATISDRAPIGEAIDRAARLLAVAEPGQVLADALTAELMAARFHFEHEGDAWLLQGQRERESPRKVLGRTTPFVGRDAELALLEGLFAECAAEHYARVALVTAPAGIGKSRLRDELLARLAARAPRVWLARANPLRRGAPLDLLAQLVRAALGLAERDPLESKREAIAAALGADVAGSTLELAGEIIGDVIGVALLAEPSPRLRAARADPAEMADRIKRICTDLVRRAAAGGPVVVVLDDLQWADAPSVSAIESALAELTDSPVLLIGLARPEVHERFPRLFAKREPIEVRLPPLRPGPCARLVAAVLPDASSASIARLVEQSEGNALLLEELARATVSGRADAGSPTVLAMLASRLDAMELDARLVLRAASVIGLTFWLGAVRALVAARAPRLDVAACLSELVDREVLVRHADARFESEVEYSFRHTLVHEAATTMLTDADRVGGHRAAARWLQSVGSRDAGAIAEHYEAGGELGSAVPWWLRAARSAFRANAMDDAAELAERAVRCGASGETLGDALTLEAEVSRWLGRSEATRTFALDALALLPQGSRRWLEASIEAAIASLRMGDHDGVARLAASLVACEPDPQDDGPRIAALAVLAQALLPSRRFAEIDALLDACGDVAAIADPWLRARVLNALSVRAMSVRDVGAALDCAIASTNALRESGRDRAMLIQLVNHGFILTQMGALEEAQETLLEAMEGAERLALPHVVASGRCHLGRVLAELGREAEARSVLLEAVAALDEQGNRRLAAHGRVTLAMLDEVAGATARAHAHARAALERLAGAPGDQLQARAILARISLREGEVADALAQARETAAASERLGPSEAEAIVGLVHTEVAHAAGAHTEARDALHAAVVRLLGRADAIVSDRRRGEFLGRVSVHRRILELDALWRD